MFFKHLSNGFQINIKKFDENTAIQLQQNLQMELIKISTNFAFLHHDQLFNTASSSNN